MLTSDSEQLFIVVVYLAKSLWILSCYDHHRISRDKSVILSKGYKDQNQVWLRFSNKISNLVRWQLKTPYDSFLLVIGDYEAKRAGKKVTDFISESSSFVWSKVKETGEKKRRHELGDTGDSEGEVGEGQRCSHQARHIPQTHTHTYAHISVWVPLSQKHTHTTLKRLIGLQLLCLRSVFLYMCVSPVVLFTDTDVSEKQAQSNPAATPSADLKQGLSQANMDSL